MVTTKEVREVVTLVENRAASKTQTVFSHCNARCTGFFSFTWLASLPRSSASAWRCSRGVMQGGCAARPGVAASWTSTAHLSARYPCLLLSRVQPPTAAAQHSLRSLRSPQSPRCWPPLLRRSRWASSADGHLQAMSISPPRPYWWQTTPWDCWWPPRWWARRWWRRRASCTELHCRASPHCRGSPSLLVVHTFVSPSPT